MNGSNAKLQGLKVLVIDDSKTIRRTAETLLAKEGCEVFTAIDGFDALAAYFPREFGDLRGVEIVGRSEHVQAEGEEFIRSERVGRV